ncbi:MAG: hypothetical protein GC200_07185 [Tepidisphaera sp.]|nr:hypothetical protein [Tepidisphaera sp.]
MNNSTLFVRRSPIHLLCVAALCAAAPAALAQWSADPGNNLAIGDLANDQVQAKIKPTSDGGCYITWFDNATGGYDVKIQRLDRQGFEQFPHNGILLADRSYSSTVDYDMVVDASDNAIVTFRDNRSGTSLVTVTKVTPSGDQPWGASGVQPPGTTNANNPHVAVLSDGSIASGYSVGSGFTLVRLDPTDGHVVAGPVAISESGRTVTLSDLQPGDNGSVIALWVRPFTTSFLSSKYLYTQKYDSSLTALWTPPVGYAAVPVYAPQPSTPWPTGSGTYGTQGGSIQNGYFPTFVSDGAGGGVFGWYENAGPRNAYIQHILADGTAKFQANGLPNAVTDSTRIRISGTVAYDRATGEYYSASAESANPTQGNYSAFVQHFTAAGQRTFTDSGLTILPTGTGNQPSFVQVQAIAGGCVVTGIDSRSATTGVVFAAGVDSESASVTWSSLASSTIETKSRLTSCNSTSGDVFMAFSGGATGSQNMYAQNVSPTGVYGNPPPMCNPDVNQDGVADQGDVDYLINVIAGGENPTGIDADFNGDGVADQGDVDAIINVIAGGPCP